MRSCWICTIPYHICSTISRVCVYAAVAPVEMTCSGAPLCGSSCREMSSHVAPSFGAGHHQLLDLLPQEALHAQLVRTHRLGRLQLQPLARVRHPAHGQDTSTSYSRSHVDMITRDVFV